MCFAKNEGSDDFQRICEFMLNTIVGKTFVNHIDSQEYREMARRLKKVEIALEEESRKVEERDRRLKSKERRESQKEKVMNEKVMQWLEEIAQEKEENERLRKKIAEEVQKESREKEKKKVCLVPLKTVAEEQTKEKESVSSGDVKNIAHMGTDEEMSEESEEEKSATAWPSSMEDSKAETSEGGNVEMSEGGKAETSDAVWIQDISKINDQNVLKITEDNWKQIFDDTMEKNVINGKHEKKKWKELFVHEHRDYVYYLCRDRIETNLEIDLLCNIFSPHFVEKWDHKSKLRCQLKRNFFSKLSVFKNIVPITTSADLTVWSDNKRFSDETELF